MNRTLMITATAALLALVTSHHARAQRDDAPPRTEKLSEWPKLKKAEADRALLEHHRELAHLAASIALITDDPAAASHGTHRGRSPSSSSR